MTLLQDFLLEAKIRTKDGEWHSLGIEAYAMDKIFGEEHLYIKKQLKMDNFHCCDYIYPTQESILFIEDTNLIATRDDWKKKVGSESSIPRHVFQFISELISESIRDEILLKAYGTLLIFDRLLTQCEGAKDRMGNRKLSFWVIVNDADSSEAQAFDNLQDRIQSTLRALVPEVVIYPLKKAREKLQLL
ncbi:MAG: hypothetical protein OXU65_01865 [Deltaproteobacteria bacterium]|nr:hypothetical protein [Deltaproteobacteria bacterium]